MYRVVLTLLLMVIQASFKAQGPGELLMQKKEQNLIVKDWTVIDGLSSNSVRKIGKTSSGFLFIPTYNGISFFDGKNFINYNSKNVSSIISNNIYDFCIDADSVFWIATHRGIIAFNGRQFYIPDALKYFTKYSVQRVNFDKKGTLWIGTTSNGLFRYRNNLLEKIHEIDALDENIISLIFPDREGDVWIGTEKGDLYRYNGKEYTSHVHSEIKNAMLAAIQDNDGNYFFGTRNGLYTLKNDSIEIVSKDIKFINDIKLDKNGNLWIATNLGLYYYNKISKQFYPILSERGLNNQIIQTVYFDDEDIIWIGTYRKGLLQLRIGAFQNYPFSDYGIDEVPSAITEINDSTLWIGTDEGKVFEMQNGKYTEIHFKHDLSGGIIKSIFTDSKKNRWICSYKGLLKLKNGTEHILSNNSGFHDNSIRGIVETNDGNFWIATRQSGLHLITGDLKTLKTFNTGNGLSSNFVMSLVKGKNGKLFIATKNGLDIVENEKITKHYGTQNGLAGDMIFNIYEDSDHVLWIATISGLSRLENETFTNFNKKNGMVNEKVFDIIEDELGYLWLPTVSGIVHIRKSELNDYARKKRKMIYPVLFDKSDGIYDQQYVSASKALKRKNGQIVFNTISGISILDPYIANSVNSNQSLFINRISTESSAYPNNQDLLSLPSSTKYLQVEYSYIDFVNPDKVAFKYMLEPFDFEWQRSGSERFAKYTNLPPGEYLFKLKAIVKSRGEKVIEESIRFVIEPSFYETIWFRVFASAILILLTWFIYVLRVRNIKYQKQQLEKEVIDRTTKISQQKEAIERNIKDLETQKFEIASKNEEILIARNKIEQAYLNLKLLSDLGKEITSSLSEEEIGMTVYQNINSLMDTGLVSIGNYNKSNNTFRFNSTIFKGKKVAGFETKFDPKKCILSFSVKNGIDIITNDFQFDYPTFKQTFPDNISLETLTSVIVFPIRAKNEIIGVMTVQSFRKNSYSNYHFNLLQNLAVYVGIAIENSKTYIKIREQKDELQKVNAAKDKMFSIIGHDLRSPVGTIKSFLDIIIENPEMANTENTLKILKTMQQSLGSAYALLDNLLLWARSQRGKIEYKPDYFYIKQPIDESINLVTESARIKEISIETIIGYDEQVFADQNMITTVLRNLISNAIKFTPRKGHIQVITTSLKKKINGNIQKQIEIKVIDNGIGISKENINKILKMNKFFSSPGTEKEQGSGLGIGICIDFLKMHNQKLFVKNNQDTSDEPLKGSTFKFYLNRSSKPKPTPTVS